MTLTSVDMIVDEFGPFAIPGELVAGFNIAPTDPVPIIANREDEPAIELVRWGLVPPWAKEVGIGARMINARLETVASKPAFRDAFKHRRCLVIADGFYEWKREGKVKTPFHYRRVDKRPFSFAGLWDRWKQPDGEWLLSCTVITGEPNDLMAPLHDRMPVIVGKHDRERWLHPEPLPRGVLDDILVPPPADGYELHEVSRYVNSVRNQGPKCLEPETPVQQSLF